MGSGNKFTDDKGRGANIQHMCSLKGSLFSQKVDEKVRIVLPQIVCAVGLGCLKYVGGCLFDNFSDAFLITGMRYIKRGENT